MKKNRGVSWVKGHQEEIKGGRRCFLLSGSPISGGIEHCSLREVQEADISST